MKLRFFIRLNSCFCPSEYRREALSRLFVVETAAFFGRKFRRRFRTNVLRVARKSRFFDHIDALRCGEKSEESPNRGKNRLRTFDGRASLRLPFDVRGVLDKFAPSRRGGVPGQAVTSAEPAQKSGISEPCAVAEFFRASSQISSSFSSDFCVKSKISPKSASQSAP